MKCRRRTRTFLPPLVRAGGAVFIYGWLGRKRGLEEKGEDEAVIHIHLCL